MSMVSLRVYLIRLKTTLVYKTLINNLFLLVIGIVLAFLSFNHYLFLVALAVYLYYLYTNNIILFRFCSLVLILIFTHYYYLVNYTPNPTSKISSFEGQIIDLDYYSDYTKILVKSSKGKVIVYSNNGQYCIGDIISLEGTPKEITTERVFKGFNYYKYLKAKKIIGVISATKIIKIGNRFHIGILKQKIYAYLSKNFSRESYIFLRGMLLGDTILFDEDFKMAISDGGIMHLFAISGLHIQLFIALLEKLLGKLKVNLTLKQSVIFLFLQFYIIITSYSPSVLRASLMYILAIINKKYKLRLSSLDIVSFVFIFLLIINPFYIQDYGFILSFSVSFIIIVTSPLLKEYSPFKQNLILSLVIQVFSLPIVVKLNNSVNVFSPFINVIFIFIISSIILPLSISILFMPYFDKIFIFFIVLFKELTIVTNEIFLLNINFPIFSPLQIIILFLIVFYLVKNFYRKNIRFILLTLLFMFFLGVSNTLLFDPYGQIYFLDLSNGESIIIKSPFNQCNVVIDTGDGTNNEVSKFLKNHGFKKIDYLVLTHNHYDHNGEALSIINNFLVKNIVVSFYDESFVTKQNKVIRVREGDELRCSKYLFEVLNPSQDTGNENDNSIVLYTRINQKNFLFLGDVTQKTEERIIQKYNIKVDVLKVAHHGSSTSTSPIFIDALRPQHAIIMNGRVEKFGFPHQETLETLRKYQVKVYSTKEYYSIKYEYFFKNEGIFYSIDQRI